jgi:mRNA interferase HigB
MKVLGRDKLLGFAQRHANAKKALEVWFDEISRAAWQSPLDIKAQYRSVDFLADNRVIFNIKGNHYRLVIKVKYQQGIALIEWVGTHAEYDKQRF